MATLTRILILGLILASIAADRAEACTRLPNAALLRAQLLTEVNARRTRNRLARLTVDSRLEQAAWTVSCDNATRNLLSHTTADGGTLASRMRQVRYAWRALHENIAMSSGAPAQVVALWMNSPGHRANILSAGTVHFGAAVARSRSGAVYWTMVAAAPR